MEELFTEILHEITGQPARFAADVLQSALLLGILVWAGRRYVAGRLAERRARIATELTDAGAAEHESDRVRQESLTVVTQARDSAAEMLRGARERAVGEREASVATIEAEAQQIVAQARTTVELEKAGVHRDVSDRLVHLTSEAARRYLEEMLTETERRALTQKAILTFLDEVEASTVPGARS
jgi:ATP synthase F0 subunit b